MQTSIRTETGFDGISSTLRFGDPLYRPLYHVCGPGCKGHADLTSSPPSSQHNRAKNNFAPQCWAVLCESFNTEQGLRSLPELTEHLTARADDNHAPPVLHPRRSPDFSGFAAKCQTLVRFAAYRRIKPRDPPLVRVPVNSFMF